MLKMTNTMAYAISTMVELAQMESGRLMSSSQVASACGMPARYLLQILRQLVEHGLLISIRGTSGGYRLARKPQQISVLEIIDSIEGRLVDGSQIPTSIRGKARAVFLAEIDAQRERLHAIKLASLLD